MPGDRIFEVRPKQIIQVQPLNPSFLTVAQTINNASFTQQTTANNEESEIPASLNILIENKFLKISLLTWLSIFLVLLVVGIVFGAAMVDNGTVVSIEDRNHNN